ncbi:MAG: asparagine synthase (glutamine-hydrolyzing) [Lachnospiraceae bacterium]|nr:asparagine synthase (glutamine-hydrolyzing) [Lachnospiraceae bacterium]
MCGISGFVTKKHIDIPTLKAMNDTMIHRGPDDEGVEIYEMKGSFSGYSVGFAQRRLSIIDLSPLGHQPMHSQDGRISVVFNGEIYNFLELKKELKDYGFKSDSDTEVIIAAYLKWGIDFTRHINGMFAIALFDRETQDVYLVRDRIGKKPLYYELEEGNIYFASELKPLMVRPGFSKKIRREILSRYLYQQYINAPDTIFENVYKLEPGSVLTFSGGNIKTEKYWDIKDTYFRMQKNPVSDLGTAKQELKDILTKSVRQRMISDVPLGTFLSGGYDSSLVTAIAQSVSNEPVKTFSIGFNEERFNEARFAKEVADHLGTDHTELYISEDEMYELVESIPQYYDEPFADSSQIATMMVSKLAKSKVTVALSGDGGDEFFCGYNIYERMAQAQKLDGIGGVVHALTNIPGIKNAGLEDKLPFKARVVSKNRNPETKTQLGSPGYLSAALKMVPGEQIPCNYEFESRYGVKNWQIRRMLLDMDTYLPGDILCKVDRASMKYSLESRCPILDKEVMEYSFRLSHDLKYHNGIKKYILKEIAYDYIPKELLERPKTGFGVPLDKWLRGPLKEQLLSMCDTAFLKEQGLFDPAYTSGFVNSYLEKGDLGPATGANYSKLTWSFFVFQQWYQKWIG